MDIITEAANWVWLQQQADPVKLQTHLGIRLADAQRVLARLADLKVVEAKTDGTWQATPLPAHFFQKKGRSLYRTLTIYQRPLRRSTVVGVVDPHQPFLTHSQRGDWWLVCNHLGRIGYINVDSLNLVELD